MPDRVGSSKLANGTGSLNNANPERLSMHRAAWNNAREAIHNRSPGIGSYAMRYRGAVETPSALLALLCLVACLVDGRAAVPTANSVRLPLGANWAMNRPVANRLKLIWWAVVGLY